MQDLRRRKRRRRLWEVGEVSILRSFINCKLQNIMVITSRRMRKVDHVHAWQR
jgi:hypothetical protein